MLGTIEEGLAFDDLLPDCIEISLQGYPVRVLGLAAIVRHKRASSHPKDQRALPILEEALRQLTEND